MLLQEIKNKPVIFTGHSLGGSLASLAALQLLCSSSNSSSSSSSSTPPVLCVTFGSPLLGNDCLSRAVLRERWAGNFCHVVAQHDVVPRLLFCPADSVSPRLVAHLQLAAALSLSSDEKTELHRFVSVHIGAAAEQRQRAPYMPFGTYTLCSDEGAMCVDNPEAAVQLMCVTFMTGWPVNAAIEAAHRSYGELVDEMPRRLLMKKRMICMDGDGDDVFNSNYEAGASLALKAVGVGVEGTGAIAARECLRMSKSLGLSPSLNCANLAIRLGKITPCRAQIEWYKASCDATFTAGGGGGGTGYYDCFRHRRSPKKDAKANMNRVKLGNFWDGVITMLDTGRLPHDFHRRAKWVNAAHSYQLLVEPLDIAEYHRNLWNRTRGPYLSHGRPRRHQVFDRWWKGKEKDSSSSTSCSFMKRRSKFAGLTQDSCFWAKVEQAREWVEEAKEEERDGHEHHHGKMEGLWKKMEEFECYSEQLVMRKEVSVDVLAPGSSYSLWVQEWKELNSRHAFHSL